MSHDHAAKLLVNGLVPFSKLGRPLLDRFTNAHATS
jgi:hypothetical protein